MVPLGGPCDYLERELDPAMPWDRRGDLDSGMPGDRWGDLDSGVPGCTKGQAVASGDRCRVLLVRMIREIDADGTMTGFETTQTQDTDSMDGEIYVLEIFSCT